MSMRGNRLTVFAFFVWFAILWSSCNRERIVTDENGADTLVTEDSLQSDTIALFEEEDDKGLSLDEHTLEVFGDFFFAFTHNNRFQAERIRFPLPVTDMDGTERTIRSGKQFRSEFQMPENDYYTLLLGEAGQVSVLQNDSLVEDVAVQFVDLTQFSVDSYNFHRQDGHWHLISRAVSAPQGTVGDFFRFYERFVSDSLYQQECLARQLRVAMPETDEEEVDDEIVGTIDSDQWPAFRPEMPEGRFVNIDFGHSLADAHRLVLLQCGFSNSMMDFFTFRREGDRWTMTAYEH